MKFPFSWLKEFIPIDMTASCLAEKLTMLGLEVEGVEFASAAFENVVVAKVLSVAPHPHADKLVLAKVYDGKEELDIVCGAPNCRPGIKTALAKAGAVLKGEEGAPFTIKKSKIRGFPSEGMLCSHEELHLTVKECGIEGGIMEFPDSFREGTDLKEIFADPVFTISLTPNLGHASSLLGVARELGALEKLSVKMPSADLKEVSPAEPVSISLEDPDLCPRYACRLIKDVVVGPSPEWLAERLVACGLRPVNNVVDITNYVFLELGHPLHAFDLDKLEGKKVVIRKAKEGETIVTLDQKERFPTTDTLLICDAKKPAAIAGIMGGASTEVSETTKNILLEAAYFEPKSIRRASKRLGLQTDASRRFERGTDPNALGYALNRAACLLSELASGKVAEGILEAGKTEFPEKEIKCRVRRVNQILGIQLGSGEIEEIFSSLGFRILSSTTEIIKAAIPTYRCDIAEEIDLIEEVARLFGYDNLYREKPSPYREGVLPHSPLYLYEQNLREILLREGLQELLTLDLISPKLAEIIAPDCLPSRALIHIVNPTSLDQSILRHSLLPGLLQVLKSNIDHGHSSLLGYEIGKVHFKTKSEFLEPTVVSLILSGKRDPYNWHSKPQDVDFYDLKGMIETLLKEMRLPSAHFIPSGYSNFHPARQAEIMVGKIQIGMLGEVHPATLEKVGIKSPVYFAELGVDDLIALPKHPVKMSPLPRFPATTRDLTLTVRNTCPADKIFSIIEETASDLLDEFSLLDVYHSEKLGSSWKNVTFRFIYRDQEKTISFKAADFEHDRIKETVINKLRVEDLIIVEST